MSVLGRIKKKIWKNETNRKTEAVNTAKEKREEFDLMTRKSRRILTNQALKSNWKKQKWGKEA
jgi:hypothetical protein